MGLAILKLTISEYELLNDICIGDFNLAKLKLDLLSIGMKDKKLIFKYNCPYTNDVININYDIIKETDRKIININLFLIDEHNNQKILKSYYGEDESNKNTIFLFGCYQDQCLDSYVQKRINSFIEKVRPNTLFTINPYVDPTTFETVDIIDYLEFETLEDKTLFKELIL